MKKGLILLVSAFILFSVFFPYRYACAESLEQKLERIKREKEETSRQIEQVKKDEQFYISQIEQVEGQMLGVLDELEGLKQELDNARLQVQKTNLELELKGKELEETERDLEQKIDILNQRVSEIYKNKELNYIQVVLASEDFTDFMSRLKLMVLIAEQDAKIIKEVRDRRQAITSIRQSIQTLNKLQEEHKKSLEALVAEQETKRQELEQAYEQKKGLLSATISNKNTLMEMEKQLAAEEAEIKKKLESLRHGNAPQGELAWPTKGILVSGFGYRDSPIFGASRFHSGVDIACDTGTPVIAAEGGEVVEASHMGGYGNSVLIYHGGGVATFYAHLSGFAVSGGQKVQRGQVIGYVGTTGWTTGPHLHFEVRINGVTQNPLNFL
ncbi:MAG: murein hydrolase activator EnvC family protein [Actinomycetota bacterium]